MSACNFLGRWRGRPAKPLSAGMASMHCSKSMESCRLAPLTNTAKGMPLASTTMCLLEPSLPLSVGLGPVCGPPGAWNCRAVNAGSFPIDLVMLTKANQHRMVQLPPHPSGLPIAQSTPTRHATAEAHGLGQVFPGDTCLKHKQNSIESSLIADSALARASLVGWNKGGDQGL